MQYKFVWLVQGLYSRERREKLRWTWANTGKAREQMRLDTNIITYFIIGHRWAVPVCRCACACVLLSVVYLK